MDFVNLVTIRNYGTTAPIGVQSNGTQLTRNKGREKRRPFGRQVETCGQI